jgi:MFS family permease
MQTQIIERIDKKQLLWGTIVCAAAALFYCYEFILRIIPGVLQSEISAAFGNISATTFGQLSAFYYFAYSPMQMPVGLLMDRFGPKRLLTLACLCCTIGSWMFSFTSSILIASYGRFLVGFGSSFAFVGVLSLAVHWIPKHLFSLVVGLMTTLGMLGVVYGEIKITNLALNLGLNHVLSMMVFIGAGLSLLLFFVVQDGPKGHITYKHPLPEFFKNVWKVLASPQVWLIGVVGACLYTSLSVFGELWGKNYLQQAHNLTKSQAAASISLVFLGWAVGAPISGYFSDKTGKRVLPLTIGAIVSLICISIILYIPNISHPFLNLLLFLYGVFSGTEIIVFVMAKENSGAQLAGTVFAATNMIVTLGGVIFQPLVGILLDSFGDNKIIAGEHVYTTLNYQLALSILPISLLMVIVFAFFMKDFKTISQHG